MKHIIPISGLSATDNIGYSLWKATRHMKIPRIHVPPIRKNYRTLARRGQDKAEAYAQHLTDVFKLNDMTSELDLIQCQSQDEHRGQKYDTL